MAVFSRSTILLLFVFLALLTVPILIGVYVYRDARRRGMNAVLWTLIAVAAPALIGFIIYLLVRGKEVNMQFRINTRCAPTAAQSCALSVQIAPSR